MRAFASGILVTSAVVGFFYFQVFAPFDQPDESKQALTESTVQQYLEEHGLEAVDADAYTKWQKNKGQDNKKENSDDKQKKTSDEQAQDNPSKDITKATIAVKQGMSTQDVIDELVKQKIIKSGDKFQDYLENHNLATGVQIGKYKLSSDMSMSEVADKITK